MIDLPRFDGDCPPPCTKRPDLFYPDNANPLDTRIAHAKAICETCQHLAPCRAYAVAHHEPGIWGATTEDDRRRVRDGDQDDPAPAPGARWSRYRLWETTTHLMTVEGLTVRECAARLGLTYEHVTSTRRQVRREIERGQWRPSREVAR